MNAPEIWAPVAGWAGRYEVSTHGRVRSCARSLQGKLLTPNRSGRHRYLGVTLSGPDGCQGRGLVHQMVLTAFAGPRPQGMVCRHIDGNPENNALSNLRWGTLKENSADKWRHGTVPCGTRSPAAKLTDAAVREAMARRLGGESWRSLARSFGVTLRTIRDAVTGVTWRHVHMVVEVSP